MSETAPRGGDRERFAALRQGHVLASSQLGIKGGEEPRVLISQTCDIVLDKRPTLTFASVVSLDGDELALARKRDNPRYVALPAINDTSFADLAFITTIAKSDTAIDLTPESGIDLLDDRARRDFALAVGRWFSRFAFPDEVVPWLRPVLAVIRQKHDRPDSPIGKLLNAVVEFRVEASDWLVQPLDLTLHVIVPAGTVPQIDDPPDNPALAARLRSSDGAPYAPSVIAEIIPTLSEAADLASIHR